jgi:hypothetical protein
MNIEFPPAKARLSELYRAMKQLQADNPAVQRVPLVKPARFNGVRLLTPPARTAGST